MAFCITCGASLAEGAACQKPACLAEDDSLAAPVIASPDDSSASTAWPAPPSLEAIDAPSDAERRRAVDVGAPLPAPVVVPAMSNAADRAALAPPTAERALVDLHQLEVDTGLVAATLSSDDGSLTTLVRERLGQWQDRDRFERSSIDLRSFVEATAGAGTAADVGALQHDGTALGEFRTAESAIRAEADHLKKLDAEIAARGRTLDRLRQKARNIKIAIGCAVAGGSGLLIFLISKVAG
jgi:hypothetical protein